MHRGPYTPYPLALTFLQPNPPQVCNYAGTCKRSLENHMRMHVRQLKAIGDNAQCTQCVYTSAYPDTMLRHYITHHPGLPYFKMAPKGTHIIR